MRRADGCRTGLHGLFYRFFVFSQFAGWRVALVRSIFGREGLVGEYAAAVSDIVTRLLERHRAGRGPAPTGAFGGRCGRQWLRRGRAGTRPAPTGLVGDGVGDGAGGGGQAQGLPLQVWWAMAWAMGQAGEGRHKACPYRFGGRWRGRWGRRGRAGTRPAPTEASGGNVVG